MVIKGFVVDASAMIMSVVGKGMKAMNSLEGQKCWCAACGKLDDLACLNDRAQGVMYGPHGQYDEGYRPAWTALMN